MGGIANDCEQKNSIIDCHLLPINWLRNKVILHFDWSGLLKLHLKMEKIFFICLHFSKLAFFENNFFKEFQFAQTRKNLINIINLKKSLRDGAMETAFV